MKWLAVLGKALISIGVGFLLFVAWMLKGTDLLANREQSRLQEEFSALAPLEPHGSVDDPAGGGPPRNYRPGPGEPVFRIEIPSIDVNKIVVEGVDTDHLRKGPGHYPFCREGFELCTKGFRTAWPGEEGRVVVSGHRTTYGAPFWSLNRLDAGDEIRVETRWGAFAYSVVRSEVVDDQDLSIVIPGKTEELVLTTCNPRFSAAERLVVFAELEAS
jgi:sortase A